MKIEGSPAPPSFDFETHSYLYAIRMHALQYKVMQYVVQGYDLDQFASSLNFTGLDGIDKKMIFFHFFKNILYF